VLAFSDIPSGNGGKLALVLTEKEYGGVPPVAEIVQPAYGEPCVPPEHEDVVIRKLPCEPPVVTVTVAVEVIEPEAFDAVNV
jgi:hypothetical protein